MYQGKGTAAESSSHAVEDESYKNPAPSASRLEALRMSADDEPELSDEQIISNAQLQQDELLVLGSIYGENIVTLDKKGDLLPLQMYVHFDFPEGLTVSAKLQSSFETLNSGEGRDQMRASDNSNEFSYSFKVRYLPPIVLTCLLAQSYPSHKPPQFTISGQWLDTHKISALCQMLDVIWSEQRGYEVIYRWTEWLHSSALSYLGFDSGIILGPYDVSESGDKRAISENVTPEIDIPSLIGYNDKRCHETFLNNQHQCDICFSDYAGTYFVKLPCQHFFCKKCMETYCTMHVKEGTVTRLMCPESKCGGWIQPTLLKQLLGEADFIRWESLLLQKTLDSMSDVIYCPRCETACLEDEDHHAQCPKCYFDFCSNCRERRHVGTNCASVEERLRSLQIHYASSFGEQGSCDYHRRRDYDQRRKEQEMINELFNLREVLRDCKQCPSCHMAISRVDGCNKMICRNCGQLFCYRCNNKINGYDHFRQGCPLFPLVQVGGWEAREDERVMRVNNRLELNQRQAEEHPDLGHTCPSCRKKNAKVGNNNHIMCWSCGKCFCSLCLKRVKKMKEHFGPKGCKQHSVNP